MSKYFKLGFGLGGSKVYIFLMDYIDGDVTEELDIESYDHKMLAFDKLYQWAGTEVVHGELDLSPLIIGNYRFTATHFFHIQAILPPIKKGFSERSGESREGVRGKVELIDAHKKSSLKDDLKTLFERRSFP